QPSRREEPRSGRVQDGAAGAGQQGRGRRRRLPARGCPGAGPGADGGRGLGPDRRRARRAHPAADHPATAIGPGTGIPGWARSSWRSRGCSGSFLPSILEARRRAERALTAVVAQGYVEGVSTRRVDDVARAMGIDGVSKSQVSRLCAELDDVVAAWRNRPLDAGPYAFVWLDALVVKVREGGRVANTAALVATGCTADGYREILGLELGAAEGGAARAAGRGGGGA